MKIRIINFRDFKDINIWHGPDGREASQSLSSSKVRVLTMSVNVRVLESLEEETLLVVSMRGVEIRIWSHRDQD
jgi:hypothetical protein